MHVLLNFQNDLFPEFIQILVLELGLAHLAGDISQNFYNRLGHLVSLVNSSVDDLFWEIIEDWDSDKIRHELEPFGGDEMLLYVAPKIYGTG